MTRSPLLPACLLAALCGAAPASAESLYLRLGASHLEGGDATFKDADCASTQPPALFGCQIGEDGRRIAARGGFGQATVGSLGLGWRAAPAWRLELEASLAEGLEYRGKADFLRVSGGQPVRGEVDSRWLMAGAYYDLPVDWKLKPYVGVGLGRARHELSPMTYRFPSLGATAVTVTPGGTQWQTVKRLSLGVSWPLNERLALDAQWSYLDMGEVETDAGPARIVRASGERYITIDRTRTRLTGQMLGLSLRYSF